MQALLPLSPDGASRLNDRISVVRENQEWTYFYGTDPIFRHPEEDRRSFRMFTSQLFCQGACRQTDIIRTFGVSANSGKRSVKKYREEGVAGFYRSGKVRGPTVITEQVVVQAQELLNHGRGRREVADELGIKYDTLRKAINQGRLHEPAGPEVSADSSDTTMSDGDPPRVASDKSERSVGDASA